ncbi:GNAT family N-acetyltransferase [Pacificimonas sp. WHA3]|uniref:GNAT family N-acetyltransferase n=1 Tax=Pacificimonas pallii TaxID=2827236 RepID=A0ABS6SGN9_9SPHN|nr:GNAT family N-acetyltransferase [Pacificimonas pallii]MBV7257585.1 GNAT family N-acetyltransferase [Pacificimonas pallii]
MFMVTDRLFLRPLWPEDADSLTARMGVKAVVRNLGTAPWPYTRADAEQKIAEDGSGWPAKVSLGIFLRTETGPEHVGGIGFGKSPVRARETELGYWIAPDYWGQGIAAEAGRAVLEHAFMARGHERMCAGHYVDNPNSGKVLRKLGFRPTGEMTMYASVGRGCDVECIEYELSRTDWSGDYLRAAA